MATRLGSSARPPTRPGLYGRSPGGGPALPRAWMRVGCRLSTVKTRGVFTGRSRGKRRWMAFCHGRLTPHEARGGANRSPPGQAGANRSTPHRARWGESPRDTASVRRLPPPGHVGRICGFSALVHASAFFHAPGTGFASSGCAVVRPLRPGSGHPTPSFRRQVDGGLPWSEDRRSRGPKQRHSTGTNKESAHKRTRVTGCFGSPHRAGLRHDLHRERRRSR